MGNFQNIDLKNFRNFNSYNQEFSKNCNVFFGHNGSGKTNLLEAISLFSKGRGLRKDKICNIIKKNNDNFIINSKFYFEEITYNLLSQSLEKNQRKIKLLKINGDSSNETLDKFYELASFLSFVPETERFFLSSPSNRRNLIDRFIFVHSYKYDKLINNYNKYVLERSKLLNINQFDINWLEKIERNISSSGLKIYSLREKQINYLIKYLNFFLKEFNLSYKINVKLMDKYYDANFTEEQFIRELHQNRSIDGILGGSKIGPHKSDYLFYVNNDYLVSQLSTGQQKTIILLLYLSQCKFLIDILNKKPILLLDEICSHLDEINRKILLTLVESLDLQVFMTGTTKNLFSFLSTNSDFYNITA